MSIDHKNHKFCIIPRPIPVNFSICLIEAPFCSSCLIVFSFSSLGIALNSSHVVAVVISLTIPNTCVSVGFGARYSFGSNDRTHLVLLLPHDESELFRCQAIRIRNNSVLPAPCASTWYIPILDFSRLIIDICG